MKNNTMILFLIAFTVIATAITIPIIVIDNQENIYKNIQCYGYYGC